MISAHAPEKGVRKVGGCGQGCGPDPPHEVCHGTLHGLHAVWIGVAVVGETDAFHNELEDWAVGVIEGDGGAVPPTDKGSHGGGTDTGHFLAVQCMRITHAASPTGIVCCHGLLAIRNWLPHFMMSNVRDTIPVLKILDTVHPKPYVPKHPPVYFFNKN